MLHAEDDAFFLLCPHFLQKEMLLVITFQRSHVKTTQLLLKHVGSDPFLASALSLYYKRLLSSQNSSNLHISQVTALQARADPLLKSTVNKQTQVSAPFKVIREALPRRANFNKEMHDLKGRTLKALNSFFSLGLAFCK